MNWKTARNHKHRGRVKWPKPPCQRKMAHEVFEKIVWPALVGEIGRRIFDDMGTGLEPVIEIQREMLAPDCIRITSVYGETALQRYLDQCERDGIDPRTGEMAMETFDDRDERVRRIAREGMNF